MFKNFLLILALFYAAVCFAGMDVNKATEAELDSINGIGPAMSSKILAQRKQGNFKDWNDFITRVKGMGQKNAAKFSNQGLTVDGAAFKSAAAAPAAKPAASAASK